MPRRAARVAVLLVLLAVVAMWAIGRTRARRSRGAAAGPIPVAVLVLGEAPPGALAALGASLDAVARRLGEERARHAGGAASPPLAFEVVGPLRPERLPPVAPPGEGWPDRLAHAWDLWRAARAAHAAASEAAAGFDPDAFEVRVYLVAAPGGARSAEGIGEAGGEVAVVRAGLGDDGLLAATAAAHEVLHTLGATDKYDAEGHARLPEGLVEPDLAPLFPQHRAELMVGEVPLAPGRGRLPSSARELGVGPATAAELGWTAAAR